MAMARTLLAPAAAQLLLLHASWPGRVRADDERGSAPPECVAFRRAGGCSASGPRDPNGDAACDVPVLPDWAGFCECGGGLSAGAVGCGHGVFTCRAACDEEHRRRSGAAGGGSAAGGSDGGGGAEGGRSVEEADSQLEQLFRRGKQFYVVGNIELALRHYREALRLDPDHKEAKADHKKLKKLQKAMAEAEAKLPKSVEGGRKVQLEQRENAETALKYLEDALAVAPPAVYRAELYANLCKCHTTLKEAQKALSSCAEHKKLDGARRGNTARRGKAGAARTFRAARAPRGRARGAPRRAPRRRRARAHAAATGCWHARRCPPPRSPAPRAPPSARPCRRRSAALPARARRARAPGSSAASRLYMAEAHVLAEQFDEAVDEYKATLEQDENSREAREGIELVNKLKRRAAQVNYYKVLNVSRSASEREIKRAYHKLAVQYHPDKYTPKDEHDAEAADKKFKEIARAYEVLSDEELRRKYDLGEVRGRHAHARRTRAAHPRRGRAARAGAARCGGCGLSGWRWARRAIGRAAARSVVGVWPRQHKAERARSTAGRSPLGPCHLGHGARPPRRTPQDPDEQKGGGGPRGGPNSNMFRHMHHGGQRVHVHFG